MSEEDSIKHIHRVVGDGNCLLRAIGLQINKTHLELRNDLYKEYHEMKEYYSPFFVNIDSYMEQIKNNSVWCGEEDIAALANISGANIELYMNNLTELYMTYRCRQKSDNVIGIIYVHGNHYDAVLRGYIYCDGNECNEYSNMICDKCLKNFCTGCEKMHYCITNTFDIAKKMVEERDVFMGIV